MTNYSVCLENVTLTFPVIQSRKTILRRLFSKKDKGDVFRALDNISFNVKKGEIIGVLGKNGSGKTTLLKTIANIYHPDDGRVLSSGEPVLLSNISCGFNANLSGIENIKLKGSIHGLTEQELKKLIPEIIDYSGIGSFIEQPVRTYSSGMKARLGFAVTCFINPEIILLDELLIVGDYEFSKKSREKIMEMVKGDATAIIATHSESTLRLICDRVLYIEKGRLIPIKDVDEAVSLYRKSDSEEE